MKFRRTKRTTTWFDCLYILLFLNIFNLLLTLGQLSALVYVQLTGDDIAVASFLDSVAQGAVKLTVRNYVKEVNGNVVVLK